MMKCHMFIIIVTLTHGIYTSCVHDEVQSADPVKSQVAYHERVLAKNVHKSKRSTSSNLSYKPIRLKFFKLDFDFELTQQEKARINKALTDAVNFIEDTFSVVPVNGSLLLKRTGCQRTWHKEPNAGKCAVLDKTYREEYCHDAVKIPEAHLGSLSVWRVNKESTEGEEVFPAGEGVPDADTVLYITAKTTRTCFQKKNHIVLAYAGYCQLDQYDRPIAGYINFCPYLIRATNMTQQKVYMSVVHELFHALGFSKGLFDKFRDCSQSVGGECPRRKSRVVRQIYGVTRLVTSAVINRAQEHFSCRTEERFGVPLQVENGVVLSHWSQKSMYGSIMAPKLGMAHQTVIDPLTLAFFEDTGWYKVDYSQAGLYQWGKDGGCKFGSPESCQKDSKFFCKTGKHKSCHYLHMDKGQCRMVDRHCGVVETDQGDQCSQTNNNMKTSTMEKYSECSLCFMSNLTMLENESVSSLEGICLQHRCDLNQTLHVRVESSDWIVCPYGDTINVSGYHGYVKCPEVRDIVCPLMEETVAITTVQVSTSTTPATTTRSKTSSDLSISSTKSVDLQMTKGYTAVSSASTRKFKLQTLLTILHSIMFMFWCFRVSFCIL
ncbi:leishmanolysin-like peptidase 2 [Pecten maximus]|uniref:leishmanolysin-like peptidase 2 n=1 Tax=Pecten maximus TaxID=6579 RepID=UPI001458EDDF|nr:leishmanolysin-like peptidase 2 [Pecten maximus]XP_033733773.1 leishmanolysin-like peptidase 2 [Pecten maximus]